MTEIKEDKNRDQLLPITPETKIGALLDTYPDLEPILVDMAPEFAKLKNPVLRKTIAKVATLKQAADLGKIPLGRMINTLRCAAGQPEMQNADDEPRGKESSVPKWVEQGTIGKTLDARPLLERGEHPVKQVMQELGDLQEGTLYELITPFLPAPLIDMAKSKGFKSWTREDEPDLYRTFFASNK